MKIHSLKLFRILLIVFFLLSSFAYKSYAHGLQQKVEKQSGDVTAILGYNPLDISSNIASPLTFTLRDNKTNQDVVFDDVWVNIKQDDRFLFASGIRYAKLGVTSVTYTYPQSGNYEISARFENGEKTLAEVTFPLKVVLEESNEKKDLLSNFHLVPDALVGFMIGLIGGIILAKFLKKKK